MTGAALYQKHLAALKATERAKYDSSARGYVRVWPTSIPVAWEFVSSDMRRYYNDLAARLTPRKAGRPFP